MSEEVANEKIVLVDTYFGLSISGEGSDSSSKSVLIEFSEFSDCETGNSTTLEHSGTTVYDSIVFTSDDEIVFTSDDEIECLTFNESLELEDATIGGYKEDSKTDIVALQFPLNMNKDVKSGNFLKPETIGVKFPDITTSRNICTMKTGFTDIPLYKMSK